MWAGCQTDCKASFKPVMSEEWNDKNEQHVDPTASSL